MDVEQRARAVFGLSWADYWMGCGQPDVAHDFDAFSRAEAWALQRFHSAITPPECHVVVTRNEAGQAVAVTRQDDEGRILSVIAEFGPPTGYVLVPVEPTEEMLKAGGWVEPPDAHGQEYIEKEGAAQCWRLMMDARPEVKP